ncbi:hypothetical protein AVEN_177675-1, partial [Araneus ventricosus]
MRRQTCGWRHAFAACCLETRITPNAVPALQAFYGIGRWCRYRGVTLHLVLARRMADACERQTFARRDDGSCCYAAGSYRRCHAAYDRSGYAVLRHTVRAAVSDATPVTTACHVPSFCGRKPAYCRRQTGLPPRDGLSVACRMHAILNPTVVLLRGIYHNACRLPSAKT